MPVQPRKEDWETISRSYTVASTPAETGLADEIVRMLSEGGFPPPRSLLEAGCGSGHLSLLLRKAGYATDLLDFSDTAIAKAQAVFQAAFGDERGSQFILGDLMELPTVVGTRRYDVVWNSGVLEHFSRDMLQRALTQMKAAAREAVLFIVPNPDSLIYLAYRSKMLSMGRWDVGVEFLRQDYADVAKATGLELVASGYCGRAFTAEWLRFIVNTDEERRWFASVLSAGQAAPQTLYLQYFLCTPDPHVSAKGKAVGHDDRMLDRTFYLDALGTANAAIARLQKDVEAAEARMAADRDALARHDAELRALREQCDRQNRSLATQIEAAEQLRKDLQNRSDEHDRHMQTMKAELEARTAERDSLQKKLADSEANVARLTQSHHALAEVLSGVRNDATQLAWTLESWKMHKSFRAARILQLIKSNVLRGPFRERLRFIGRVLGRLVGRSGRLSTYNVLDAPIGQASRIAALADRGIQHLESAPATGSSTLPALTEVRTVQTSRGRILSGRPRRSVVNIVTNLFLDFKGKEMMSGGAERYVIELCRLIRELGYTPEVYQCGEGAWERTYGDFKVVGIDIGGDIWNLNTRFHDQIPPGALTIYSAFYLAGPRCHPNSLGISHGIFWDSPLLQQPPDHRDWWMNCIHLSIENCSRVVSVDTNTINWLRACRTKQAGKFIHIPNFVDTERFTPSPQRPESNGRIVVLYPRRLYAPRGFWLLAELVPYFLEKYPHVEFHFVGKADEKETEAVRKMERAHGDRVRWYSLDPDGMCQAYRAADIALIPTIESEGTSLSCLEAMASGNAIIATNVGGLPELITDGHNGLLISPTREALKEALERLIDDGELRRRLGHAARQVSLCYGRDIWRSKWRGVLRSMLPETPPAERLRSYEFVHLDAGGITWSRMKQRPHHLMRAMAQAGHGAFFVEDQPAASGESGIPGLTLVGQHDELRITRPILYVYFAYNYEKIRKFDDPMVLYDILDDPRIHEANDRGRPPEANYLHYHNRLLAEADVVITSSRNLHEQFREQRPDILLVPNGVWPADFQLVSATARPADLPPPGRTIVGYYGAIAEWFDFRLLTRVAGARPDYAFVLIGLTNRKADVDRMVEAFPNIRYLGEKPYEELPTYLSYFDVAMIPFVVNDITNAVSPVKLFEYLAGGKPVVSTGFAEIRQYEPVLVAEDAESFVSLVDRALDLRGDPEYLVRARRVVEANTWQSRAATIIDALDRLENPAKRRAAFSAHNRKQEDGLQRALASEQDCVFCFPAPSVPWGYMFQRPQQLARSFCRLGYPVIYAVDPDMPYTPDSQVKDVLSVAEGPLLYRDDKTGRRIRDLGRPVVCWQYWPHQAAYVRSLPAGSRRIYDCLDDTACFTPYPELERDHAEALASADLVLASASDLLDRVSQLRPDALHLPNGAWYEDFAEPQPCDWPELDALRARSPVLIGYYGALAEWIDWNLLEQLVRLRRDWSFVLVGELVRDKAGSYERGQTLSEEPNVEVWPRQPYQRLGYLLSKLDVATIPFVVTRLTHAVSPIKLFEYMAGGKPVVSTPLRECAKYPLVRLAGTAAEFAEAIEASLVDGRTPEHRAKLQACGAENSWIARAETVVARLKTKGILR